MVSPVVFDVLHVPDCPNLAVVRDRLDRAIEAAGVSATIRVTEVSTPADAARLDMHGSPTVLIDGRDPFLQSADETSLSCRLYTVGTEIAGAPSTEQIAAAITAAAGA